MINPILNTDSYKTSHYLQYPPGTEHAFSYVESRGGDYPSTVFFGLQAILKAEFQRAITAVDIDEAEELLRTHGMPFNRAGWQRIVDIHGGFLPLEVRAVAEGSVVPTHQPLMTVVNTDPELPWVTSYAETALLRVWYPITVATISYHV
ncbi:MAG: nicotinate phosphoribosyltransferase, partial [Caulobacter sp.]|nr:nicotinate phosphoribosyltransferase [Caulobacter sp.]